MAGEIKVGQVWKQRDGQRARIARRESYGAWGTVSDDEDAVELANIADNGFSTPNPGNSPFDLIELVQDENGFTIWRGGECPVPAGALFTVRFRNGTIASTSSGSLDWGNSGSVSDIVAYKLVEQPATDSGVTGTVNYETGDFAGEATAADAKDLAADMLSDLGWHFDGTTWVQDDVPVSVETTDSALAVQVGGSHYKDLTIQPIEYIHANKLGFAEGNVVKYITRHRQKHGADDIRKVIHYCQLLLELEYGGAK